MPLIPDRSDGLLALGAGFQGFLKGMQDAEDRKMKKLEFDAKMKASETERQNKDFDRNLDLWKAGAAVPPQGEQVDFNTLQYRPDYVETQERLRSASSLADPYGAKAIAAQNAKTGLIKNQMELAEASRKKTTSPVPGYQKGPNYVADDVEERSLRSGAASVQKFNGVLNALRSKVQSASKADLANPWSNVSKAIKNDLRDLQLIYKSKDFAELGVLTGPDLSLLEQVIEDPGSISNLYSGNDGVLSRYSQLQEKVQRGFDARAQAAGLIPAGGGGLIGGGNQEAKERARLEELRRKAAGGG